MSSLSSYIEAGLVPKARFLKTYGLEEVRPNKAGERQPQSPNGKHDPGKQRAKRGHRKSIIQRYGLPLNQDESSQNYTHVEAPEPKRAHATLDPADVVVEEVDYTATELKRPPSRSILKRSHSTRHRSRVTFGGVSEISASIQTTDALSHLYVKPPKYITPIEKIDERDVLYHDFEADEVVDEEATRLPGAKAPPYLLRMEGENDEFIEISTLDKARYERDFLKGDGDGKGISFYGNDIAKGILPNDVIMRWLEGVKWITSPSTVSLHTMNAGSSITGGRRVVNIRSASFAFYQEHQYMKRLRALVFNIVLAVATLLYLTSQTKITMAFDLTASVEQQLLGAGITTPIIVVGVNDIDSIDELMRWILEGWYDSIFPDMQPYARNPLNETIMMAGGMNGLVGVPSILLRRYAENVENCPKPGNVWQGTCLEVERYHSETFGTNNLTFNTTSRYPGPCDKGELSEEDSKHSYEIHLLPFPKSYYDPSKLPCGTIVECHNFTDGRMKLDTILRSGWDNPLAAYYVLSCAHWNPQDELVVKTKLVFEHSYEGHIVTLADESSAHALSHGGTSIHAIFIKAGKTTFVNSTLAILIASILLLMVMFGRKFLRFVRSGQPATRYVSPRTDTGFANLLHLICLISCVISLVITENEGIRSGKYTDKLATAHGNKPAVLRAGDILEPKWQMLINAITFLLMTSILVQGLDFNPQWRFFSNTLSKASSHLYYFFTLQIFILFGFSFVGFIFYGSTLKQFYQFRVAVQTLFQLTIGLQRFSYNDITSLSETGNNYFGVLFFWSYVFIVVITMTNLFLAIITDSFDRATKSAGVEYVSGRSLWSMLSDVWGTIALRLFKDFEWIEVVKWEYPLSTDARFQYQDNLLIIELNLDAEVMRLLTTSTAESKDRDDLETTREQIDHIYIELPFDWTMDSFGKKCLWSRSNSESIEYQDSRIKALSRSDGALIVVESPKRLGLEGHMTLCIACMLSKSKLLTLGFQSGPLHVCATSSGRLAVAVRHSFENIPIITLKQMVSINDFEYKIHSEVETRRAKILELPLGRFREYLFGVNTEKFVDHCRNVFQHELRVIHDPEDEKVLRERINSLGVTGIAVSFTIAISILLLTKYANINI